MTIFNTFKMQLTSRLLLFWIWVPILPFLFILCLLAPAITFANATTTLDSLRNALAKTASTSEQITLMNELSYQLKDIDSKQSLAYAQKAMNLSRLNKDIENELKAMYNIGTLIYDSPNRDSAFVYFVEGARIAGKQGFGSLQADHLMSLANWYRYHQVDSTKTVNYFLKSVEVSKRADYSYGIARSYAKLASFYTRHKEIELCEKYLELSAKYYLQMEKGDEEIAHYYNEVGHKIWDYNPKKSMELFFEGLKFSKNYPNIKISLANAHYEIEQPNEALKYLKDAIVDLENMQYYRMKGIAISKLAEVYVSLGDYKAALKACNDGIALLSPLSMSNQSGLPAIYRTKGHLMEREGKEQAAMEFYTKSLHEAKRINEIFEITKSSIILGTFYSSFAPEKAKAYCEIGLKKANKYNFTNLEIAAYEAFINIYKKEKNHAQALKVFEQKEMLKDSLGTIKVEHALNINSQLAEKDRQLSVQSHEKELKEAQLKTQYRTIAFLLISSLLGLLLIGMLSVSLKRIRNQNLEITQKTKELEIVNQHLAQSNEDLERFASVASHDLKSPLKNIISFTGLLRRKIEKDASDSVKDWLGFIENSGKTMYKLIDDILQYSKLSSPNSNSNQQEKVNLTTLVNEISQLIATKPGGKLMNIEAANLPVLNWNYSKLFQLFKNLIENGLKYNESENPTIKVYASDSNDQNIIYIEDNGIGIKEEDFDKVFVMFQRLHDQSSYSGTGLGLASCKKIVDEFKGKINISSTVGKGTIFKIEIPENLICNVPLVEHKEFEKSVKNQYDNVDLKQVKI